MASYRRAVWRDMTALTCVSCSPGYPRQRALPYLSGIILDKDWAVFIIRKSGFTFYIASLGRNAVRLYQGIGFTIGAIAALFLFAYYSGYFNK